MQSLFSKVTETPVFCNSVKKSKRAWYVPKSNYPRSFGKFSFNGICRLTVYSLQMLPETNI